MLRLDGVGSGPGPRRQVTASSNLMVAAATGVTPVY